MTLLPVTSGAFGMSEALNPGTRVPGGDLSRLTVSSDGRLYWDDKPVVVRRRLLLSFWQKLGTMLIGLACLMIALSATVHAAITAHDWMCSARWVSVYCPKPVAAQTSAAGPAQPQSQSQSQPQSPPSRIELPN